MPSYRVTIDIVGVPPEVRPEDVLPTAEGILAKTHSVEDRLLDVVHPTSSRPQPQLHLRFAVAPTERWTEDAEAEAVVRVLMDELDEIARCGRWQLRRGPGRPWHLVAAGGPVSER